MQKTGPFLHECKNEGASGEGGLAGVGLEN